MAKKSSKSSRRVRITKKTQTRNTSKQVKQQPLEQGLTDAKPVVAKKPAAKIEAIPPDFVATEENVQPQRRRMLVNAVALGVVIAALVFVAVLMRQQASHRSGEMVKSNGDS